jgi:hypothetical protein
MAEALLQQLIQRQELVEAELLSLRAARQARPPVVKPPAPDCFTGASAASAGPRITDFLYQLDLFFAASGLTEDEQRVSYAATLLREHAMAWWRSFDGKATKPTTWEDFKLAAKQYFQPAQAANFARDRLSRLRQTRSVQAYVGLFRQVALDINDTSDADLMAQFRRGLKEDVALQVAFANPATLEDTIHTALRIDEILHQSRDPRAAPPRSYAAAASSSGPRPAPMELGAVRAKAANPGHAGLHALTELERAELRKSGGCFRCRQPGHLAKDCPLAAAGNARRQ